LGHIVNVCSYPANGGRSKSNFNVPGREMRGPIKDMQLAE
jgi:hypothetical protein